MEHSFDIKIAEKYGIAEAIIYKNLLFWIMKNKSEGRNYHDGKYWSYNTVKSFLELFPYLSYEKIRSAINNLIEKKVLVKGNYNTNKYNRTLWYAFNEEPEELKEIKEIKEISSKKNIDDEKNYDDFDYFDDNEIDDTEYDNIETDELYDTENCNIEEINDFENNEMHIINNEMHTNNNTNRNVNNTYSISYNNNSNCEKDQMDLCNEQNLITDINNNINTNITKYNNTNFFKREKKSEAYLEIKNQRAFYKGIDSFEIFSKHAVNFFSILLANTGKDLRDYLKQSEIDRLKTNFEKRISNSGSALLFALDDAFKQPVSYRKFNFIKCLNAYLMESRNIALKNTENEEQEVELEYYKGQ